MSRKISKLQSLALRAQIVTELESWKTEQLEVRANHLGTLVACDPTRSARIQMLQTAISNIDRMIETKSEWTDEILKIVEAAEGNG